MVFEVVLLLVVVVVVVGGYVVDGVHRLVVVEVEVIISTKCIFIRLKSIHDDLQ